MRQSRLTWPGAYHHIMNRGINDEEIFKEDCDKSLFLKILAEKKMIYRIRIFAYCIMNNHYHLVIENSGGKMGDFLRNLNGQYARIYRRNCGGRGYVFQDRYQSTIIENDSYLIKAIIYVLANPLKVGLIKEGIDYPWYSYRKYFKGKEDTIVENHYIEELFGSATEFKKSICSEKKSELKLMNTRLGKLLGSEHFFTEALQKYERRHRENAVKKKRRDDFHFEPADKVIWEFERKYRVKYNQLDITTHFGKRLRGELLRSLKDNAGMTYSQINELSVFSNLKFNSLGHIYKNAHNRKIKKLKLRPRSQ